MTITDFNNSPLKPRFLALIQQYLPNISDPVYSVHQSFMWFLWLNCRRKSTLYPVTAPNEMLTYCDVIDTSTGRKQLWRNNDWLNDRLFPRGFYGRFLDTMILRAVILRVCKGYVCAKFFWICEAVKCLASDVMINWPRARRTVRNNGFDHNVAAGYQEKCKRHDWTGQGQGTAWIMALIILLGGFCNVSRFLTTMVLKSVCEIHVCAKFSSFIIYRKNLWSRELFGKWRHNWLAKGNAHRTNNGFDYGAATRQHENSDSWYRVSDELCTGLVLN